MRTQTFKIVSNEDFIWTNISSVPRHVLTPVVRKHICSSTMMMANTVLTLKQGNNYKGYTTESVIEKDKSWTKWMTLQGNIMSDFGCSENHQIEFQADTGNSGSFSAPLDVCASEGHSSVSLNHMLVVIIGQLQWMTVMAILQHSSV